jgi:hypothetical protein
MTEPSAGADARPSATRLSGWPQRLLHLAALVAGWGLFVWGWYDVLGQPWDTRTLTWLVVGSVIVFPVMTTAWVLHNVGIHRRKGPRTSVRPVDESYRADWNGREVGADPAALAGASIVVIDIQGERKHYRPAGTDPLRWTIAQSTARPVHAAVSDDDAAEAAGVGAA